MLAYFVAGEQALREALVLAQAATQRLDPLERDVSFNELNLVIQQVARGEIEAFCGVCQFRHALQVLPPTTLAGNFPAGSALHGVAVTTHPATG